MPRGGSQLSDKLHLNGDMKIELIRSSALHGEQHDEEDVGEHKELLPLSDARERRRISRANPHRGDDDGKSLKYIPILSQTPTDFVSKGEYGLRYTEHIRILLVITMYNERREELDRTLKGIGENLRYLQDKTGVKDFWKEVVICIVADGRAAAEPGTLLYMTEKGFFSDMMMQESMKHFHQDEIAVHLFESTIQIQTAETINEYYPPMQIMFALKEKNAGKIHSHWWFYMAFAEIIKPEYCFLLDVGTCPKEKSFYYMFRAMEKNARIAGVAGEITTIHQWNLTNPLIAAQQFEYKMSSIFDRTMESMFGYVTVLPGAFSAYRWKALSGDPMKMYFHSLVTALKDQKPFEANMYLAEDRILCYELVAKRGCNYILHFVREAVATTDVPSNLPLLIKQRRRWLNGSLFALIYALLGWKKLMQHSSHSLKRKFMLSLQYLYFAVMVLLQWTAVANYYMTFYYLVKQSLSGNAAWCLTILRYLFLALLLAQFVLGLGNRPGKIIWAYNLSAFLYGLFTAAILGIAAYEVAIGNLGILVIVSVCAMFGSVLIVGAIFNSLLTFLASFVQYTFFTAAYVIMFPIYSLCNTHDISWGTKNLEESKLGSTAESLIKHSVVKDEVMMAKFEHLRKQAAADNEIREQVQGKFEQFRSILLLVWMFTNGLYVSILTSYASNGNVVEGYLTAMFVICMCFIGIKAIGAILYFIQDIITSKQAVEVSKNIPSNLIEAAA
eukprot:TRINITY_DN6177_c0_g2_i1.p1 TRINITY_DN6177_c0_g2~~TRINITY_DN6177_c0_g2_i1.p1  ORF type:complete len:728 (+),score=176.49 TRINITY_DN6177_c0_g2_i1:101-2284(+)